MSLKFVASVFFAWWIGSLALLLFAPPQSSMSGGTSQGGTVNFNGNNCGPPSYACSNVSTGNVGTIASIFSSTAPTTTTCAGDCQNTIRYDTTMNPANVDPYVRVTDASTTCAATGQSFNASGSGGSNDRTWSINDDYLLVFQTGAAVCLLHMGLVNGNIQVLNTGTPALSFAGNIVMSSVTDTRLYYVANKTQIHQVDFNAAATSVVSDTQIVDVAANGTCPGLPANFSATSSGIFGLSSDDNTFSFILSNAGGQNTAVWFVSWNRTNGCATANSSTGTEWAYCTSSCTPSTSSIGTLVCYGQGLHESLMSFDAGYAFLSPGGGNWTAGSSGCNTHNGASVWQIGTANSQWASDSNPPGNAGWISHTSQGETHTVSNNFGGPLIRTNASVNSPTQFAPAYSPVLEDWHAAWPAGSYTDALAYIIASDLVNAANASGCATSAVYCPIYQHNEIYALFPQNTTAPYTTPRRFGHTFSCGQTPHAVCTGGGDAYFQGQEAIMGCSPDGKYCALTSTMLGSLGLDGSSNPRQDVFLIRLD